MSLHNDIEAFTALIEQTAKEMHMSAGFVEKDYYVCDLLKRLFSLGFPLVFKGGTSFDNDGMGK